MSLADEVSWSRAQLHPPSLAPARGRAGCAAEPR